MLIPGTRPRVVLALVASFLLAACGTGSDDEETQGSTADGKRLYEANCAQCHGADLEGTSRGPSHLSQVYEPSHHGDDAFRSAIANGSPAHHWNFGDMPPISGVSESEADAIIAYVRAQQAERGFQPYPPQ